MQSAAPRTQLQAATSSTTPAMAARRLLLTASVLLVLCAAAAGEERVQLLHAMQRRDGMHCSSARLLAAPSAAGRRTSLTTVPAPCAPCAMHAQPTPGLAAARSLAFL